MSSERGGRGGAGGGGRGGKPRGGPPRGPRAGAPRSSGARREGGGFGGPRGGAPRSSSGPRRDGGGFGDRGPRRDGGKFGGPPRTGSPRRDGGGFGGDRGPRREGGKFGGPPRTGGPRREGGGFGGDRGPRREGGKFGGPPRTGGPRREGGGFGGDRGPRREGGTFGGPPRTGGPRREGGGFGGDRGPRREGGKFGGPPRTGAPRRDDRGFGGGKPRRDEERGAKAPSWGAGARPRAATGGFGAPRRAEGRGRPFAKAPAPAVTRPGEPIRLQALLARAGVASRREAETMIVEGRVQVNGQVVTQLGTKAIPGKDHVKVDGKLIGQEERKVYFLFHKPGGVITAASDPHGRPVVVDYLKVRERIFPVGRLDWDTEGLLILTNDGDLAYRLTHPSFQVPRTYHAKVKGIPDEKVLTRLRRGVRLDDGKAFVEKVRAVGTTGKNTWLEVIVTEGRNRLVRRILEAVGHPVQKLKRTAYGGLVLGNLKPGQSRVLSKEEVDKLFRRVAVKEPHAPAHGRPAYDRAEPRRPAFDTDADDGEEWVSSKDASADEEE